MVASGPGRLTELGPSSINPLCQFLSPCPLLVAQIGPGLSSSPLAPTENADCQVEWELGRNLEGSEELRGGEERGAGERFWSCGEGVT